MHPSDFFKECIIDEIVLRQDERDEMKEKLMQIHPRNILGSSVDLFVVKAEIEYGTTHGNRKTATKYTLLPLDVDEFDSLELQAEIMCESNIERYNMKHIDNQLKDYKVQEVEVITKVTLPIG